MKKVIITGISGFVGSHLLEHLLINTNWEIIGIASWRHKGTPENIITKSYLEHKDRVTILTHDISVPFTESLVNSLQGVDYIFNLASESHVARSIDTPVDFVENNVSLMVNMLELAREIKPALFLQFSTDEVYGGAPKGTIYKEWDTFKPSNPYAASKAAQEMLAVAYWKTYGIPIVITNCMNIFGERQDKEKFVSLVIDTIKNNRILTVHGSEDTIGSRFYLHARNISDALLWIAQNISPAVYKDSEVELPDKFHISGEVEVDNLTLAKKIADIVGKDLNYVMVDFHTVSPGHDRRYALDGSKLKDRGWVQPVNFEESLKKTIQWTLK